MLRKALLSVIVAVLLVAPFAVEKAEAWHICDHFSDAAPDGLRGAITASCWAYLTEMPDRLGDPNDWASNGGIR
jgi:hypothetical protein